MTINDTVKERLQKIMNEIGKFSKYYEAAVIKLVSIQSRETNLIHSGTISFSPKGVEETDEYYDYGYLQLLKRVVSINDAISVINGLIMKNEIYLDNFSFDIEGSLGHIRFIPSKSRLGYLKADFSTMYVEYSLQKGGSLPHELLVTREAPLYPDSNKAVSNFLGISHDTPQQTIIIQIPDYRAKITTMKLSQNRVIIKVEPKFIELSNLACKFFADIDRRSTIYGDREYRAMHSPELCFKDDVISYEFEDEFDSITAVLVEKSSYETIDSRQYHYSWSISEGITVEEPELDLHEIIRRGESHTVEFKATLSGEFLETVVSFANTSGGIILMGVADDGRVTGFSPNKIDQIGALINGNLDPIPDYSVSENELDGKPITIVEVQGGMDKPYSHRQLGIYVRSAGSDLRGTRSDWERFYREKTTKSRYNGYRL
ncbi:helix-turn-helix domain-containing protein [Thermoproteota archaeon]